MTQDDLGWLGTKLNDSKWLRMTQNSYGNSMNDSLSKSASPFWGSSDLDISIYNNSVTRWHLREIPPYCAPYIIAKQSSQII